MSYNEGYEVRAANAAKIKAERMALGLDNILDAVAELREPGGIDINEGNLRNREGTGGCSTKLCTEMMSAYGRIRSKREASRSSQRRPPKEKAPEDQNVVVGRSDAERLESIVAGFHQIILGIDQIISQFTSGKGT